MNTINDPFLDTWKSLFVSQMIVYSHSVLGFYIFTAEKELLKLALIIHVSVWWREEVKVYSSNLLSKDSPMKNGSLTTRPFKAFGFRRNGKKERTLVMNIKQHHFNLSLFLLLGCLAESYTFSCNSCRLKIIEAIYVRYVFYNVCRKQVLFFKVQCVKFNGI